MITTDSKTQCSRLPEIVKRAHGMPFAECSIRNRFTIVHVVSGIKHIQCNDIRRSFSCGDTICMSIGMYQTENIPDDTGRYEEIAIEYSADELQKTITRLHLIHDIPIVGSSDRHGIKRFCGCRSERITASLFDEIAGRIGTGMNDEYLAGRKSDLIYILMSHSDNDTVNCILENMDSETEVFVRTVYANIFNDCTIEELAAKCNQSVSTFKAKFFNIFGETPHRWLTKQRLKRACFLLLNTDKSVKTIGEECMFGNQSHFCKIFRHYHRITPAAYRRKMRTAATIMCEAE